MRKYHYLVLFLIGFLILWPFVLHKLYVEKGKNVEAFFEEETDIFIGKRENSGEPEGTVSGDEAPAEKETVSGNKTVSGDEAPAENGTGGPEETPGEEDAREDGEQTTGEEDEPEEDAPPELFFQDTLFIGDSRTMGLAEYADLNNASVFANSGMSVYRLYSLKNAVQGQPLHLEDILAEKQYRKIYVMLGINELGYDEAHTVKRFEEEVLKLREAQPDAKIILEANLHVTSARSGRDKIFNNEGIDRINENIRLIAEKYGFSYIDVNEAFDDETGGLDPDYTHDEVHVLGKYYQQWADWIRETGE